MRENQRIWSCMHENCKSAVQVSDKRCYLFLDEVQAVDGWEKSINSISEEFDTDIYVTGSNSKVLSSEISSYLSGRFISIPVFILSFSEYINFQKFAGNDSDRELGKLLAIKDNYPKYVITLDELVTGTDDSGIRIVHLKDFLLKENL